MSARKTIGILASVFVVCLLWLIPVVFPRLMIGTQAIPALIMIMLATIFVIVRLIRETPAEAVSAKRKAAPDREEVDIYSTLDRLVTELSADEAAYLQRKLADRAAPPPPAELTALLDEALAEPDDRQRRD